MFVVGDPVRISSTNGPFFAQANCTAIQNLGNGLYQLTLDQSLNVPPGTAGSNPKYNGSGYKLVNCQLGNCRSRAIIAKADSGLISGCTIRNSESAIQLGPENYWGECDYVWNVMMTNNAIVHCGTVGLNVVTDGAIGNRNFTIQNNYFQDMVLGDPISLNSCAGVTIAGNTFGNPVAGSNPVWLNDSTNITLAGNFVTNDASGVSLVGIGTNVTGVQNQSTGIFLARRPYTLISRWSNLVLDDPAASGSGTQVVQVSSAGNDTEHWVMSPVGNGYCALICVTNGLALGVDGSVLSGAAVVMEIYTGVDSQLWSLTPVTNNYVALTNKLSGLALHVPAAAAGQGMVQEPFTGSTNQQWFLLSAPLGVGTTVGNGIKLSWLPATGATGYSVARATLAAGPYVTLASNLTSASYLDTTALAGTIYYYVVSSSFDSTQTAASVPVTVWLTRYT
jgi:hypothetical protein